MELKLGREPHIQLKCFSEKQVSDMGMGCEQTLTFYGDYRTLMDDHTVYEETNKYLITNGMSRWSINDVSRPIPLKKDELDEDKTDGKNTHKIEVRVMDPGI